MVGYSQSHRRWIVGFCFLGLLALPLGVLSTRTYQNEVALRSSGAHACAQVTASQRSSRDMQVRYAFRIGGESHTHGDATGGSDLWATLTDEAWELSVAQGCVEVLYLEHDPSINRPRVQADPGQHIGGLVLLSLILLLAGYGLSGVVMNARATVWTLVSWNETEVILVHEEEERRVLRTSVKKAILRAHRPAAMTPPWRFPMDVLVLKTGREKLLITQGRDGWMTLLASLETDPGLARTGA